MIQLLFAFATISVQNDAPKLIQPQAEQVICAPGESRAPEIANCVIERPQ